LDSGCGFQISFQQKEWGEMGIRLSFICFVRMQVNKLFLISKTIPEDGENREFTKNIDVI